MWVFDVVLPINPSDAVYFQTTYFLLLIGYVASSKSGLNSKEKRYRKISTRSSRDALVEAHY